MFTATYANICIFRIKSVKRIFRALGLVVLSSASVLGQGMLSIPVFKASYLEIGDSTHFGKMVHASVKADTSIFLADWNTSKTHIDSIDLSNITDSIYLVLADKKHPHFALPIEGEVRDNFRWRSTRHHNGVDIRLNTGDTVYAAFDGLVRYAKYNHGGYGNLVIIRHYNGLETYYGHFSKIFADTNQYVKAGTAIGLGGSTGRSTGPHLHFEIRYLGNPIDPENIIDWECASLNGYEFVVHRDLFKHVREKSERAYYKVKSGDNLSVIARRNHTSVKNICQLNGIKSTSTIRPGQKLRVQ